jgi:hypothetical protein
VSAEDAVLYKTCHGGGNGVRDKERELPQFPIPAGTIKRFVRNSFSVLKKTITIKQLNNA